LHRSSRKPDGAKTAPEPDLKKQRYQAHPEMKCSTPWLIWLIAALPLSGQAGSLYLCKAYSGGTFWSQAHCRVHNALIESIVSVPDSLPFDQQVRLGEQQRQQATAPTVITNTVVQPQTVDRASQCRNLEARVNQLDSMARQPQSAQMQDWIRDQTKTARDQQFHLGC
jgi:hypothetical protein